MHLFRLFFDMAEYQAENHNVMHMSDYVEQLDRTRKSVGEESPGRRWENQPQKSHGKSRR